jgi:hypothetical protein
VIAVTRGFFTVTVFSMENVYIVKSATDLPPGMYGANSAVFLVDAGVPEPGGDRGHNTLVFANGRCSGTACPRSPR